jgi:hypothetical protein
MQVGTLADHRANRLFHLGKAAGCRRGRSPWHTTRCRGLRLFRWVRRRWSWRGPQNQRGTGRDSGAWSPRGQGGNSARRTAEASCYLRRKAAGCPHSWLLKANRRRGIPRQHAGPVVRTGERSGKGRRENIVSYVIGIRPYAEFGVVREGGQRKGISVIAARGVRGGRYRHAVKKRRRKHGLCRNPTTGGPCRTE